MKTSDTSLDRLHDIVTPHSIPVWPPAAGWYVVFAVAICGLALLCYRLWKQWRANAYRREALRELSVAGNICEINALLRRVALAFAPRDVIAQQTGESWPEWLCVRCAEPMSLPVREQLASGIYRSSSAEEDVSAVKLYAARWITKHRQVMNSSAEIHTESIG